VLENFRENLNPQLQKLGTVFAATGLSANFWTSVALACAFISAIFYGLNFQYALVFGGVLLLISG